MGCPMSNDSTPERPPTSPAPRQRSSADPILPWGERWDEIAQQRFNRTDWIELAATVLLSLATIAAAWSAYQATRWSGEQAENYSAAAARRTEATQQNGIFSGQVVIDVVAWITYLEHVQAGDERGAAFLKDRFRNEFSPAFEAWLALVPTGQIPPGTPFDLPEYQPEARRMASELNAAADELASLARTANQISDNFVLITVIMASVLFFSGVGTKVRSRGVRLFMLCAGLVLFVGGVWFMLSLPQSMGL